MDQHQQVMLLAGVIFLYLAKKLFVVAAAKFARIEKMALTVTFKPTDSNR